LIRGRDNWTTAVLVDANVILEVKTEDQNWSEWSSQALDGASDRIRAVLDLNIYGEISIDYPVIETLKALFQKLMGDAELLHGERLVPFRGWAQRVKNIAMSRWQS